MDSNQLKALREGLNLFGISKNSIAVRSGASPTYVNQTLRGITGNTPLTKKVLDVAKKMYEESSKANEALKVVLVGN